MVRVDSDFSAVVDAGAVSVRLRSKGPQGAKPKAEVVAERL